jgi:hypothetical protein
MGSELLSNASHLIKSSSHIQSTSAADPEKQLQIVLNSEITVVFPDINTEKHMFRIVETAKSLVEFVRESNILVKMSNSVTDLSVAASSPPNIS